MCFVIKFTTTKEYVVNVVRRQNRNLNRRYIMRGRSSNVRL